MTRRKHPAPRVDPDEYGFDLIGRDWCCEASARICLVGLDSLARDLYYTCLRPFANKAGDVEQASYYRFLKLLTPISSPRGGPRFPAPTLKQLRNALERLEQADLIRLYRVISRRERVLKIRVVGRFGVFLSDSVRAEVRADH